jgi:dephospho-CoA kinase
MVYKVGITGGIGSGKSTIADAFVALGAALVDVDAIAHELSGPHGAAMDAIRIQFGPEVINVDGSMNRAAMRELAFTQPASRKQLEAILHPMIRRVTDLRVAASANFAPYCLVGVPLLFESGNWRERFNRILVVDCPESLQIQRVRLRSGLEEAQIRAIMAAQVTRELRLANADDVIDNSVSHTDPKARVLPAATADKVAALHQLYTELANKARQ